MEASGKLHEAKGILAKAFQELEEGIKKGDPLKVRDSCDMINTPITHPEQFNPQASLQIQALKKPPLEKTIGRGGRSYE